MGGTPIGRNWVVIMRSGAVAIDWGDGLFQDAISGDFFNAVESEVSHRSNDSDLDWLKHVGRVDDYDSTNVYFVGLPDLPFRKLP